jgi:hypothetical protein
VDINGRCKGQYAVVKPFSDHEYHFSTLTALLHNNNNVRNNNWISAETITEHDNFLATSNNQQKDRKSITTIMTQAHQQQQATATEPRKGSNHGPVAVAIPWLQVQSMSMFLIVHAIANITLPLASSLVVVDL